MSIHLTHRDCAYCIDGNQPVGTLTILGPVYARCLYCHLDDVCPGCGDNSYFPADFDCQHCFSEHLNNHGYVPVFCGLCQGVTDVHLLDDNDLETDDNQPDQ